MLRSGNKVKRVFRGLGSAMVFVRIIGLGSVFCSDTLGFHKVGLCSVFQRAFFIIRPVRVIRVIHSLLTTQRWRSGGPEKIEGDVMLG